MDNTYSVIITTYEHKQEAEALARMLVDERLAACVQMFPIESVYFWKDQVRDGAETVLFIKTKTVLYDQIEAKIKDHHPYEVPEIIQIPITAGLPEYLDWIDDSTK